MGKWACGNTSLIMAPVYPRTASSLWGLGLAVAAALLCCALLPVVEGQPCTGAESVADIVVFSVQGGMVFFQSCDDAVAYCGDVTVGARVQRACPEACSTPCVTLIVDPICTGLWSGFLVWRPGNSRNGWAVAQNSVTLSPANFSGVLTLPPASMVIKLVERRCVQVPPWCL
jgi:hypothetical protein